MSTSARTPNRLINETSPYLLQHAHNPVDWYPWGDEALERARREDKPILLSVGYAACHWCHVMERESFEDPETARLMNEQFVSVKVDREERPDIDGIYMTAVQVLSGHGGWPMTVFLTPDGRPFYGGTYFPPEDRHGMPAFRRVLGAVSDAWREKREQIERQGAALVETIDRTARIAVPPEPLTDAPLAAVRDAARAGFDATWGGFGGAPKFPQAPLLDLLLRLHVRGLPDVLEMAATTLTRMARGGVFDHVGGGFHRYAVDPRWHVPHFEKMLYDNAQLLRTYTRAWLVTGTRLYRQAALATAGMMLREMRLPGGGFLSSQDADSEGVEGKFFVWTAEEFRATAGDDADLAGRLLDVQEQGNWEGANVLWMPRAPETVAAEAGATTEECEAALERARSRLAEARARRVRPADDDKVLAAWNGLAISGLAEAGRAFGRADYLEAAATAAAFVLEHMRNPAGRLLRAWRDGRTTVPAFLEDYAAMATGCLDLYEATFDPRWFEEAERLAREMGGLFTDPDQGVPFDTGADADPLVVRPKNLFDNATPAGNSLAADLLLRLAALTGEREFEHAATGALRMLRPLLERAPLAFGYALSALDRALAGQVEVALIGDPAGSEVEALAGVLRSDYRPNMVIAAGPPGSDTPPLLRGRTVIDGRAAAYVCRNFACRTPLTDPVGFAAELAAASGGSRAPH